VLLTIAQPLAAGILGYAAYELRDVAQRPEQVEDHERALYGLRATPGLVTLVARLEDNSSPLTDCVLFGVRNTRCYISILLSDGVNQWDNE